MTEPDAQYLDLLVQIADAERAGTPTDALIEQLHTRYLAIQPLGGVTPSGLPYPSPTDPLAEGANAIRALAEAIDNTNKGKPSKSARGIATTTSAGTVVITFPAGLFTAVPTVVCTAVGAFSFISSAPTTSQVVLRAQNSAGTGVVAPVHWIAQQT